MEDWHLAKPFLFVYYVLYFHNVTFDRFEFHCFSLIHSSGVSLFSRLLSTCFSKKNKTILQSSKRKIE